MIDAFRTRQGWDATHCHAADDAIRAGCKVAVCSTSNEKAVQTIVDVLLGSDVAKIMHVYAGDMVPKKKPDPAVYELAATALGVDPARFVTAFLSHHESLYCAHQGPIAISEIRVEPFANWKRPVCRCMIAGHDFRIACDLIDVRRFVTPYASRNAAIQPSSSSPSDAQSHTKAVLQPCRCVAIEDSNIGLRSAKAAGMKCIVTTSSYTADEDFSLADAVYNCIGEGDSANFTLKDLMSPSKPVSFTA